MPGGQLRTLEVRCRALPLEEVLEAQARHQWVELGFRNDPLKLGYSDLLKHQSKGHFEETGKYKANLFIETWSTRAQ